MQSSDKAEAQRRAPAFQIYETEEQFVVLETSKLDAFLACPTPNACRESDSGKGVRPEDYRSPLHATSRVLTEGPRSPKAKGACPALPAFERETRLESRR